jgi:hypothetical protein
MGLHTLGSYSGKVVFDGDSCIPLGLFSASQSTRHAVGSSLPWPLCAVRGDEDPAASEQVEAAVGNVVEDGVSHGGLESGENSGQGQRAR